MPRLMPGLVPGLMVLGVWKVPTCMHAVPASAVVGLERCAYLWGGVPTCGWGVPLRGRGSGGISRHSVVSRHTGGDEGLVGT